MNRFVLLAALLAPLLFDGCGVGGAPGECEPIPERRNRRGSQGYRIWSGPTLRTFDHHEQVLCVPEGWEPVGHVEAGPGWAVFADPQTGVVIRSDAFESMIVRFDNTPFEIELIWPTDMTEQRVGAFYSMLGRAFANVGALYPRLPEELATRHTVLITAGVAGDTLEYEGRVYPEPGTRMTVVVREPEQARSEELVIHAVAHLYNRHRTYWLGDQKEKLPIPEQDWQELVATWSETAFISWNQWRINRLGYLYNIHRSVQTNDDSYTSSGPLVITREEMETMLRDVVVPEGSSGLDYQYGHYILGPLAMVATQGLLVELAEAGTIEATSVEQLLLELHEGRHESYFAALEDRLPPPEMDRVRGWMHRGDTIPWGLVERAIAHYREGAAE